MRRRDISYTGIPGTYTQPKAWDGTPPPGEDADLEGLAQFWREHGNCPGIEGRLLGKIEDRAGYLITRRFPGQWYEDIAKDASATALLVLGTTWDPARGNARGYADSCIRNFFNDSYRRDFNYRQAVPKSIDHEDFLEAPVQPPWRFEVDEAEYRAVWNACTPLERLILDHYKDRHEPGAFETFVKSTGLDYKVLDNARTRVTRKARRILELMRLEDDDA